MYVRTVCNRWHWMMCWPRLLFLWYLRLNQHLLARPVEQLINDNTLVALALLVAESLPEQKELMIRLIEHFILLK